MGERGLPARLLAPKYGAFLTFGALRAGKESAPGVLRCADSICGHFVCISQILSCGCGVADKK